MSELALRLDVLTNDEQRILQVMSVICEPVPQTALQQVLDVLGWTDRRGAPLNRRMVKPLRERLIADRLLEEQQDGLSCPAELIEALTHATVTNGTFDAIVQAAEQILPVRGSSGWETPSDVRRERMLRVALYEESEKPVLELAN